MDDVVEACEWARQRGELSYLVQETLQAGR